MLSPRKLVCGFCSFTFLVSIRIWYSSRPMNSREKFSLGPANAQLGAFSEKRLLWCDADGSLIDRIHDFSGSVEYVALTIIENQKETEGFSKDYVLRIIGGHGDDFLIQAAEERTVTTLLLSWKKNEQPSGIPFNPFGNLVLLKYHPWTGSPELCTWLNKNKTGGPQYSNTNLHKKFCTIDIEKGLSSTDLEPIYLTNKPLSQSFYRPQNGVYPEEYFLRYPDFVTYIQLIEHTVATATGEIFSDRFKLVPCGCNPNVSKRLPTGHSLAPLYDQVFVASQFWGASYFNSMVESLPRMAPYIDILRENQNIKILLPAKSYVLKQLLTVVGIDPKRIVLGPLRAKLAYLPRATPCGMVLPPEAQIISQYLRDLIQRDFQLEGRNGIILIQRTTTRGFKQHGKLETLLQGLAEEFGKKYNVFSDSAIPALEKVMKLFYEAVMIVAPHGAGLSNILFSRPGTYIIEGLCEAPKTNMRYGRLAHVLGHHYHGVMSRGGCPRHIDIDVNSLENVARVFLQRLK